MSVDMTKWCELARKNIHARPAGVGRVAGKICIVTGAAQGFGKGIAEELYKIEQLNAWFAPYRAARGRRNRAMVEKINALLDGIALDYDRDVLPLSEAKEDGGVTERHLMYALAKKMTQKAGKGQPIVD